MNSPNPENKNFSPRRPSKLQHFSPNFGSQEKSRFGSHFSFAKKEDSLNNIIELLKNTEKYEKKQSFHKVRNIFKGKKEIFLGVSIKKKENGVS